MEIPYVPPEREFADTMLAFRDFDLASTWSVRVTADPLGPVNKVVSLLRCGFRVKSVLCPVRPGAHVQLVRDDGGYRIDDLFALRDVDWRTGWRTGGLTMQVPFRVAGWRVEVDGHTVLAVSDAELRGPITPPPPVPWRRRAHRATTARIRAVADGVAKRLGYHRDEDCSGWDE